MVHDRLDLDQAGFETAIGVFDAVGAGFVDGEHDVGGDGAGHPERFEPVEQAVPDVGQLIRGRRHPHPQWTHPSALRIDIHARGCTRLWPITHVGHAVSALAGTRARLNEVQR